MLSKCGELRHQIKSNEKKIQSNNDKLLNTLHANCKARTEIMSGRYRYRFGSRQLATANTLYHSK